MDDRGLRDIERWRDKIEVRLDNRQVFFLFFGSALVACMLFVLGVIVGKRLESRGRAVSPEIEDPLALLDKVATTPRPPQGGVTFPQALLAPGTSKHGKKPAAPALEGEAEAAKPDKQAAAKPSETSTKTSVAETKPAQPEGKPVAAADDKNDKHDKKPDAAPRAKSDEGKAVAAVQAKPEAKPSKPEAGPAKPEAKPVKDDKPIAIPTIASGSDSKGKGRFTLQLSSFQDKAEAEAFAQKFASERPYLVVSEIPGKGTWYRVRVGDYPSSKDAVSAKDAFEKKHNVIAYVAQR